MIGVSRATILGASALGGGGGEFKVGSFTAQAATGTQAITGVGFTPKAIIFWASGHRAASSGVWASDIYQTIGFTSGASESYSMAGTSADGLSTSETARRVVAKAITLINHTASTVIMEADLSSFDVDGFTLNWTTASGAANRDIMFLAIGGNDVSAKAINWTSPTATGNKAVTGVGFTPDLVLHAATTGATAVPQSSAQMYTSLGAMDPSGGEWTNTVVARDNQASSETYRYQRADKAIACLNEAGSVVEEAEFVSMDSDGFTVNFTSAVGVAYSAFISLCLSGVDAKVGNFAKTTDAAPASQAITGVGFQPAAVLFTDITNTPSTTVVNGMFWGMGAGDGINERTVDQYDQNNVSTTNAKSVWKNDKVILQANTGGSILAEADLGSFDTDGFTLDWTTNDVGAREILYLALA